MPAGTNLPTITFSFNPDNMSDLPETAASVNTLVVSWKDAAEIKLSVCKLALVMPSKTDTPFAGSSPSLIAFSFAF